MRSLFDRLTIEIAVLHGDLRLICYIVMREVCDFENTSGVSTVHGAFATPSGAWPPRDYSSDFRDAQGAAPPSQGQYTHGRPLHPAHGVRHEETGDETYEPTAAQLEAAMLLQTRPQGRDQYMYPEGLFLLRNTAPEWGGGIWRLPIQNIDPLIVAEAQLRDRWRWHQRVAHSQTDDAVTKVGAGRDIESGHFAEHTRTQVCNS